MSLAVVVLLAVRAASAGETVDPAQAPSDAEPPGASAAAGAAVAPAPPPPSTPAAAPAPVPATTPPRPGDEGVFWLRSGATVAGRLVSTGAGGDEVELRSGDRVRFPAGAIVGRYGELPSLGGDPREDDPARRRYLLVPSGLALQAGDVAVTATAFAPASLEVGVTSWLVASAGVSRPVLLEAPPPHPGIVAAVAAHAEPVAWLHLLGGVQATSGTGGAAAVAFASVTAGMPAAHVTLYAGPPPPEAGRLGRFDAVIGAAAAAVRVAPHVALVAEGWVTPRREAREVLGAVATRIFFRGFSLDAGWMQSTADASVPWIAVGWRGSWTRE